LLDKIKRTGNIFGKKIEPPIQEGETPVLLGCRLLERTEDAKRYIEILKKLGIKPKVFEETCCGMPFGVLGYKEDFAAQQENFRNRLPDKEFICMCTTCVYFIKKFYPDLKPKYVIEEIVERLPHYDHKKLELSAAYHDPCNLARGMGMVNEPREVLKEIGVNVVELPTSGKAAECCGGGGGLLVSSNQLAEKLAEKRMNQAIEAGVDTLATLCPTCEFNIGNMSSRNGGRLKVSNVLDLVWEALS
jgi:Fe-S oxidoreductase